MILLDALRPPSPLDPSAPAYKEWLHLNVLDHASGSVGLINVSLHGAPDDSRSRAIGTALVHVPGLGWTGNAEVRGLDDVGLGVAGVALEHVALAVDHLSGAVLASARFPDDAFFLQLTATDRTPAIDIEQPIPLGSGWIAWYVIPRLSANGRLTVGKRQIDFVAASAYHDHNWGRWHWGDDLGWEWGAFLAPAPGPAFVMTRTTDRSHHRPGRPMLVVQAGQKRRTFSGPSVELAYTGMLEVRLRRVPGALAALHPDRMAPPLPAALRVRADDGRDRVLVEFTARAAAQLIAGDPAVAGYGFLHEIVGEFTARGHVGDTDVSGGGLAVVEHVD